MKTLKQLISAEQEKAREEFYEIFAHHIPLTEKDLEVVGKFTNRLVSAAMETAVREAEKVVVPLVKTERNMPITSDWLAKGYNCCISEVSAAFNRFIE